MHPSEFSDNIQDQIDRVRFEDLDLKGSQRADMFSIFSLDLLFSYIAYMFSNCENVKIAVSFSFKGV
mgnify:CR=1 FL=1